MTVAIVPGPAEVLARYAGQPPAGDSHLPCLYAVGEGLRPRRVVEYGPGLASTPAFLDRARFRELESLISYEDSQAWYDRLGSEVSSDPRWELRFVERGNTCFQAGCPAGTELAFVDAGTADARVALLVALRSQVPVVVLHDYDGPAVYREAAELWPHRLVYDRTAPATAILLHAPPPPRLVEAFVRWSG